MKLGDLAFYDGDLVKVIARHCRDGCVVVERMSGAREPMVLLVTALQSPDEAQKEQERRAREKWGLYFEIGSP